MEITMKLRQYKSILAAAALTVVLTGCGSSGPSELEVARNAGISAMEQADYEGAIPFFEQAYSLCDEKMPQTKTDISLYQAACQYKLGNFEEVKDVCSRALITGDHADAYYMRGAAFLQLGEMDAAKADFDQVALLVPDDYEMFLNIYRQYETLNQSALGDVYLQQALNNDNTEMEDYFQKGRIYYYLGDYAKAQEMLARPTEAKHKEAMMLMGQVYLARDDSTHARNVYQQYIETYKKDASGYSGIAMCEIADGNYDAALGAVESGLALEGSEEEKRDLFYNQIVAYEGKHDFETAKQLAAQFVEQYPDDEEGKKEYDFLSTR
jgi:tetratricopeptide (TPR) repeat protein